MTTSIKTMQVNCKLDGWDRTRIAEVFSNGVVQLTTIDPIIFKLLVNGHCLWLYHKPTSKEEFMEQFNQHPTPKLPAPEGSKPSVPPSD